MSALFPLRCPTCGANLQIAGDKNQFRCEHCGTAYLLEQTVKEMAAPQRDHLSPLTTYTHNLQQWLRVGKYEIFVHAVFEEKVESRRVVWADVAYRNNGTEQLSCRYSQWILFDSDGYTYDASSDSSLFKEKDCPPPGGERFITPGMRVRGWVAFVVRLQTTVERLQFITGHLTTKIAEFLLQA